MRAVPVLGRVFFLREGLNSVIVDLGKRVASTLGKGGVAAIAIALLVLLPFELIAVTRITGWEWWAALAALLALNLVPFAGQLICVGLAVAGAFYLGQDNLAQRTAPVPQQTAAPAVTAQPVDVAALPADKFAEWTRTVAAPKIQDDCLDDVQRRGLSGGKQIELLAKACACYGAAAKNVVTPADVVDNAVRPTPEFNAKLTTEAKRLCSP